MAVSDEKLTPTPGIERMERPMAERYFDGRLRQLRDQIEELPPAEMLRLAADMLDQGVELRLALSVAVRAVEKLRFGQ